MQNLPSWATFSSSTGAIGGTPSASQTGVYSNVVVSVSDGTQTSSLPAFTIKVVAALTISGTPATQVTAGSAYSFKPTTSAASGTALTFSIQNKPTWASFSTSTGMLSGTPSASQTGTYSNIVISVSDGTQSRSLPAFSIKVVTASTLAISGTPSTSVNVGSAYSFKPTVTNPSGGTLTFSIQNKPTWLTFNTASGQLSGTPGAANVGTYSNIVISVSDGTQQCLVGRILDQGRGSKHARYFRHALDQRQCELGLQLQANRHQPQWRHPDLQHPEQAHVADVQHR